MNFKLITTPQFVKSVKKLSKKYKQIKNDLQNISKEIENENFIDLGYNCFKRIYFIFKIKKDYSYYCSSYWYCCFSFKWSNYSLLLFIRFKR